MFEFIFVVNDKFLADVIKNVILLLQWSKLNNGWCMQCAQRQYLYISIVTCYVVKWSLRHS